MNPIAKLTVAAALGAVSLRAQYAPPASAAPEAGLIDSWLRSGAPSLQGLDLELSERFRYEDKSDAGTTHAGSNFDFFSASPSENSNNYWLSRTLLKAAFTGGPLSACVELRTSYSFADDRFAPTAAGRNLPEDDGPVQAQMAYVGLGDPRLSPFSVRIGRQELAYGDQRLVGNAFWLNVPHAFDAVRLRYQGSGLGVDVFAARLVYVDSGPFGDHFEESRSGDSLSGVYVDIPALSSTAFNEAYLFARNVSRSVVSEDWSEVPAPFRFTAPQDIYTAGYRLGSKPDPRSAWSYGLQFMWQFGDRAAVFPATPVAAAKAAPRLGQRAWAFVAQGGYAWGDAPWAPRLALIVSGASGDRNPADASSQTFQNLLPSNHGLYGMMDMSSLQNLVDSRLSLAAKPSAPVRLALDIHQQYLQSTHDYWYNVAGVPRSTAGAAAGSGRGFGINPSYSPDIGQEADAIVGWTPVKGLLVEAGVGRFFRGEYVKQSLRAVGSTDANYTYLQATVNL